MLILKFMTIMALGKVKLITFSCILNAKELQNVETWEHSTIYIYIYIYI